MFGNLGGKIAIGRWSRQGYRAGIARVFGKPGQKCWSHPTAQSGEETVKRSATPAASRKLMAVDIGDVAKVEAVVKARWTGGAAGSISSSTMPVRFWAVRWKPIRKWTSKPCLSINLKA